MLSPVYPEYRAVDDTLSKMPPTHTQHRSFPQPLTSTPTPISPQGRPSAHSTVHTNKYWAPLTPQGTHPASTARQVTDAARLTGKAGVLKGSVCCPPLRPCPTHRHTAMGSGTVLSAERGNLAHFSPLTCGHPTGNREHRQRGHGGGVKGSFLAKVGWPETHTRLKQADIGTHTKGGRG